MLATDVERSRNAVQSREGANGTVTDHNEASPRAETDEVLKALGELELVLRENAEQERLLFQRVGALRLARESGKEWRRQSEASGYLRRSLVVALRAEGQSIPSIAHLFGVTHQRVSNLLRRVAQGGTSA